MKDYLCTLSHWRYSHCFQIQIYNDTHNCHGCWRILKYLDCNCAGQFYNRSNLSCTTEKQIHIRYCLMHTNTITATIQQTYLCNCHHLTIRIQAYICSQSLPPCSSNIHDLDDNCVSVPYIHFYLLLGNSKNTSILFMKCTQARYSYYILS